MSGHGTRAPLKRSGDRSASAVRRRVLVGAVGVLTIGLFGAAAGADDGDPGRDGMRVSAPTTEASDGTFGDDTSVADTAADDTAGGGGDAPPTPPDGLGTDAELDALAQSCFDGDLVACDHLFLQSPVGSDYEEYGDTCAGRQEAGTENLCGLVPVDAPMESAEPTPPENLGSDPALNALASDCYVGVMDACDELYDASEEGSEYYVYGDTCAGRQPENTGRYCRDLANPIPGTGPVPSVPDATTPESSIAGDTTVLTTPPPSTTANGIPAPTAEPVGLGSDPALDALAQSCFDGDMAACDSLYNESEPDSEYRRYGDTCAGRQPELTGVWCRTAFGTGTESSSVPAAPGSTDSVPVPPVTEPGLTVPPLTVPPLTVPPLTVPPLTVPPLTVPPPTVATVTAPPLPTVPPTVPPVTAPGVPTIPAFTVPLPTVGTVPATTVPAGVIPPPTLEPTGLGTNPAFDALAQACFAGDMASCDELFRESDPDADALYRNFADTCAGRQPAETGRWCESSFPATGVAPSVPGTDVTVPVPVTSVTVPGTGTAATGVPPATQDPAALGNDPQLNALAQSCYGGDMQACDDLFDQSELGTPYHSYGDTCAGRQPPGTFTYCRVAFPATQP